MQLYIQLILRRTASLIRNAFKKTLVLLYRLITRLINIQYNQNVDFKVQFILYSILIIY
jgi:hypothetical protein